MGTAGLRDFTLTVMYPEGTLEATPRELLQEILSPVGQQAYTPRSHLQNFRLSPISLHLKPSLKENVAPSQSYECFIRSDQISPSVVSDSLRPHESQHARPPCPSPTPGVHSDSRDESVMPIQPSHPLSSPSPPAPNPSQHQGLFQ